jgi:hypothetical protein
MATMKSSNLEFLEQRFKCKNAKKLLDEIEKQNKSILFDGFTR